MRTYDVSLPQLLFVAATRGLGGAGAALLLSDYMKPESRRALGWTLFGLGVLTTLPIAARVLMESRGNHTLH